MSQTAIRNVLRTAAGSASAGAADAELLARFVASRDEAAFELLVWRHAALVQRVCKAVLRDHHAAEDAAQAAFLALARKAHTISGRGPVVGWLYRVARRVAVRLAKRQARRPVSSTGLDRLAAPHTEPEAATDEAAALCAEVDRLPERYRVPVLLCFFEGLTHAEAARRTGWPIGTVAGRLARAKELLARRLSAKGVGLAAVALAVPAGSFVGSTAQAAATFAAGGAVVPGVEPSVVQLAEGVVKTMTASTWKLAAAVLCVVSASVWGFAPAPDQPAVPPTVAAPAFAARPDDRPKPTPVPKPPAAPAKRDADAEQRTRSLNNLKQILLALHNYHAANGHLPHDVTDNDGKPLLSWRVAILPYVEQDALYKQFKFDEPWDSENNKKLLAQMPDVLRVGIEPKGSTKTYYQAFAGPGTLFERGRPIKITDVTDGTSNTLAVVEAGPPVEWTKPQDIPYDPKKDLPKLEGPFDNTLIVATADGAALTLRRDLDETTLRRLIETADGNPIDFANLRVKLPLSKKELESAQELLKKNEKLINDIADQLRVQQKLLVEYGKKVDAKDPVKGIDLERLAGLHDGLGQVLEALKADTAMLKKQLEGKPDAPKPAPPKKP